ETDLIALHQQPNEWSARMARRRLAERAASGELAPASRARLREMVLDANDPALTLRALWSLHAIESAGPDLLQTLLPHKHPSVRAWAIRLLTDRMTLDTTLSQRLGGDEPIPNDRLDELARMAREDESGLVRLVLASTLQRLPVAQRPALAAPL